MRKIFRGLIVLATLVGTLFLAKTAVSMLSGLANLNFSRMDTVTDLTNSKPGSTPEPQKDPVQDQLNSMTLEQKIAQMLIAGRSALEISDEEQELLAAAPYGGYILMGGAYGTLEQTREMVQRLQSSAKIPLIITTDQEGGLVQRLQNITYPNATNIPDMYSVGTTGDLSYAKRIGQVLAEELRAVGVNVDMAPDADVFSNPNNPVIGNRSFSENPQLVAQMSQALAEGLKQNGVAATFKHFPGHGDTDTDSHASLPVIHRTRQQLEDSDLLPFKNAIQNNAQFIMVGHIALPELTGSYTPATMSYKLTTELLRNELGYQNLIITDGLNMGALTNNYSETEIYLGAVQAGADLLLLPENPSLALETIKSAVSDSCPSDSESDSSLNSEPNKPQAITPCILESRINESVYRILSFKQTRLTNYQYLDSSYFGSPEHAEMVRYN